MTLPVLRVDFAQLTAVSANGDQCKGENPVPMKNGEWIESHVPARLDRLPWSRWRWLIVVALGATFVIPTEVEESLIVSEQ